MIAIPPRTSRPARFTIGAVAAAGAITVLIRLNATRSWTPQDVLAWASLATAIALTELFPIHVKYRTEVLNLSLTEALWVGALILGRPGVLTLAMAGGVVLAQTLRRRPLYKSAFNTGQFVIAVTVARLIFELFPKAPPSDPGTWTATAVAMAGYAATNFGLVALIISLMERKPLVEVLRRPLLVNIVHFAGNTAIGLAGAVIWKANPAGLLLFSFPMALAYVAYRTLARSLRDGEDIRDLIVQNASDGIFMVSAQGLTMSWNPAMERITGYAEEEAVGRDWRDLLGAASWHRSNAPAQAEGALLFAPVQRRDGTERWVRYAATPLADPETRSRATVVVMHDATAEHEAAKAKADFVATISHELRTPLTPLKGFLQAMISGTAENSEEARQEYYRIMLRQATKLEGLVNQLLDLSRLENEPINDEGSADLPAVISEQLHSFAEQHPRRELRLVMGSRPLVVRGESASIGLVVSNLLSNAIKYSGENTPITIKVTTDGREVHVSVRDHGVGILRADQDRVFERFFQGRNRRAGEGVGLGLHIAKRVVEGAGGRIWFDTVPGEGSTFHVSLPLLRATVPDQAPPSTVVVIPEPEHGTEAAARPSPSESVRS